MYCLIIDGNPALDGAGEGFDRYVGGFASGLQSKGHKVGRFVLRELDLAFCTGCWACWWKTPGLCAFKDDIVALHREMTKADLIVWASPLILGNVSALLKTAQDRFVPMVHPYISIQDGECHHRPRYARAPDIGLIVAPDPDDGELDLALARSFFERFAKNAHGKFRLFATPDMPLAEAIEAALSGPELPVGAELPSWIAHPAPRLTAAAGGVDTGPRRLFVNGSPRGRESNSALLLSWIAKGMAAAGIADAASIPVVDLARKGGLAAQIEAFLGADEVVIAFPLYTDSVPAIVKRFLEALSVRGPVEIQGKRVAFVIQSGFPEPVHSETVAAWVARAAGRLGLTHAGTLVRGGIEGIRIQPANMTKKTREAFERAGREFAASGTFPPELARDIAGKRLLSPIGRAAFKLISLTGLTNFYWNMMLKRNGAFDKRFDAPYGPAYTEGR
jgi:multimeric flavodoxin WrbA